MHFANQISNPVHVQLSMQPCSIQPALATPASWHADAMALYIGQHITVNNTTPITPQQRQCTYCLIPLILRKTLRSVHTRAATLHIKILLLQHLQQHLRQQQPLPGPCTQACAASKQPADSRAHSTGRSDTPHTCSCARTPTAHLWGR